MGKQKLFGFYAPFLIWGPLHLCPLHCTHSILSMDSSPFDLTHIPRALPDQSLMFPHAHYFFLHDGLTWDRFWSFAQDAFGCWGRDIYHEHLELTARHNSQKDKTTQNSGDKTTQNAGNEKKERQDGNSLLSWVLLCFLAVRLWGHDQATPCIVG